MYILDSGFFVLSRDYYPDVFPSFWESLDNAVEQNLIASVEQVYVEIASYGGKQDHLMGWLKNHKNLFPSPSEEEQEAMREILAVKEFQALVADRNRLLNRPCADPFVIAKAQVDGGTVVTRERAVPTPTSKKSPTPKKARIPNVCNQLKVPCLSPEDFMSKVGWKF